MEDTDQKYEMEPDPEGCRAVVPLSDGLRLILGDGTVAHLSVSTTDGDELTEVSRVPEGGGVFGGIDHETQVEVGIITDHEAAQHPQIREALDDLGFWESEKGGDD